MNVNLGAGRTEKLDNWVRLDYITPFAKKYKSWEDKIDVYHDLAIVQPLPFSDCSIDLFYCEWVFQHLPNDIVSHIMNEVYRCLKKDGGFRIIVPDMVYEFVNTFWTRKSNHYRNPYDYYRSGRIINYYYYTKIFKMLKEAGFIKIYKSKSGVSKFKELLENDFDRHKHYRSLYADCIK